MIFLSNSFVAIYSFAFKSLFFKQVFGFDLVFQMLGRAKGNTIILRANFFFSFGFGFAEFVEIGDFRHVASYQKSGADAKLNFSPVFGWVNCKNCA